MRPLDAMLPSAPRVESPAVEIDALRRSGIHVDKEGELLHEGEPIRHQGLRQALFRWLDRLPDGRYVFRLDARRFVYVDVVDTPLVVRSARGDGHGDFTLGLSDGTTDSLDPTTLTVAADGLLRCWVRGGKCEARLSTSAVAVLAENLFEGPDGVLLLQCRDRRIAVSPR